MSALALPESTTLYESIIKPYSYVDNCHTRISLNGSFYYLEGNKTVWKVVIPQGSDMYLDLVHDDNIADFIIKNGIHANLWKSPMPKISKYAPMYCSKCQYWHPLYMHH